MSFNRQHLHATTAPDTLLAMANRHPDWSRRIRVPELETLYLANGTAWSETTERPLTEVYHRSVRLKCQCCVVLYPKLNIKNAHPRPVNVVVAKTATGISTCVCGVAPQRVMLATGVYIVLTNLRDESVTTARNIHYYTNINDDIDRCKLGMYLHIAYLVPALSTTVTQASDMYEVDDTLIPYKPFGGTFNMPTPGITFDPKDYFV